MCKSNLGMARWLSLKVISAPLLLFFATHTCKTNHVNDSACHANPAGSCWLQLLWPPREALNCLNIGFSYHFRCCRVSGMIFSCGFRWLWISHGSPSPLYQLCVGGLATSELLKCSEQTVFWQWAPVLQAMENTFFHFHKNPQVRKDQNEAKSHQSLV